MWPLDWLFEAQTPNATLFILLISVTMTFITSLTNRLLSNPQEQAKWKKEIAAWTADLNKARRSGDKKLMAKVDKQKARVMQLQSKMFMHSIKLMVIFMVPFFILWQFLMGLYRGVEVAFLPGVGPAIELPLFGVMPSIIWWYLICSSFFGALFTRLLGLGMEVTT